MGRGLKMGVDFGDTAAGRKRSHEIAMRRSVVGQQAEPLANVGKRIIGLGQKRDDPRQHVGLQPLESLTLVD